MRIGILTFHKAINYGAYLQAYSLSKKLKEEFPEHDVEIVDYAAPKEEKRKLYVLLWNLKHHGIKGGISEVKRLTVFRSMQKYLPLSPRSFCTGDLNQLYSYIDERYDLLIIGSDAVFNWNQTKFPTAYIPDYPFSIPIYTYAASVHGLRFYSVNKKLLHICGRAFGRMACIGVRDRCSEDFVKFCNNNTKTLHCCDPTLFIDQDDIYEKGICVKDTMQQRYGFSLDSKFIVVMAPDSSLVREIQRRYSGEYKIISVFVKSSYSDYYVADLNPFEWTVVLKHASLVVTSYFHGTLLSLVQGTPAIVIDYSGYCDELYEGKLKDLMLTRFALQELYFDKSQADAYADENSLIDTIQALLDGSYKKRISDAVEKERRSLESFIEFLKRENDALS